MENSSKKVIKFTYGHQFEPEKFSLLEIISLCDECQPQRDKLESDILEKYFLNHSQENSSQNIASSNRKKLAMNCFLSLRAYKIIENINDNGNEYSVNKNRSRIIRKR